MTRENPWVFSSQATPTQNEDFRVAATHEASGTQGLVCGEGVLGEGGVAQEGLQLAADVVGLEMPRLCVGHVHVKPFHDRENLIQNREQRGVNSVKVFETG